MGREVMAKSVCLVGRLRVDVAELYGLLVKEEDVWAFSGHTPPPLGNLETATSLSPTGLAPEGRYVAPSAVT